MPQHAELLPGCYFVPLARRPQGWADQVPARLGLPAPVGPEQAWTADRDQLRGMHVQHPPAAGPVALHCAHGRALVVLLDLRRGAGFGRARGVTVDMDDPAGIYLPAGVAWGVKALEDRTRLLVRGAGASSPEGVRWDSFGFDWKCDAPVVGAEDATLSPLGRYNSPF